MREIKFRAWDKVNNDMVSWEGMYGLVRTDDSVGVHIAIADHCYLYPEDCILMQFTGLKDRNGKDIYEADVVKFSAHYFGDSREKECIEVIEWDNKECCYPWKLTDTGWADGPEWCEIIGNIYENPELLGN